MSNQLTEEEIELIEYVRRGINTEFYRDLTAELARKLYKLIKVLLHRECRYFICLNCQKKYQLHDAEE